MCVFLPHKYVDSFVTWPTKDRQSALSFLSWFVSLFLMFGPLYKPQVLVRVSLVFSHLPELIFRISASFFWSKPKRPASAWPSQTPAMVIPSTRLLHSFAAWKTWWLVSYGHNCLWDFSILAEMQANPQGKANIQERNIAILGLSGRKWPNVQISDSKLETPVHPLISKKELTLNSCNHWAKHLATSRNSSLTPWGFGGHSFVALTRGFLQLLQSGGPDPFQHPRNGSPAASQAIPPASGWWLTASPFSPCAEG